MTMYSPLAQYMNTLVMTYVVPFSYWESTPGENGTVRHRQRAFKVKTHANSRENIRGTSNDTRDMLLVSSVYVFNDRSDEQRTILLL